MSASESPSIKPRRFRPSDATKIRESVMVGSVFLALEHHLFTEETLLQWLVDAEVSDRTQIAYKAVSMKIHPNDQYLADGVHFLVKQPEYMPLAVGCGLNLFSPTHRDHPEEVLNSIGNDVLVTHLNRRSNRINTELILSGKGETHYIILNLATCYQARNFPHLRYLTPHHINIGLVQADWPAKFRYNDTLAKLILTRVGILQREAPIYYAKVGYTIYHSAISKLHQEKLLYQLTREELTTLDQFFPRMVDSRIFSYDDLSYKIAVLGNDIAGYVLGFPIQSIIPNDAQIHSALSLLIQIGREKYIEQVQAKLRASYIPVLPIPEESPTFANSTDVLMEEIESYVPFDVIGYQDGIYMYRFSRAEFDRLAESKKNPWTNNWLPPTVLSTIRTRVEASTELKLPAACPMLELFDRIEQGTLFISGTDETTSTTNPSVPPVTLGEWMTELPDDPIVFEPSDSEY